MRFQICANTTVMLMLYGLLIHSNKRFKQAIQTTVNIFEQEFENERRLNNDYQIFNMFLIF